MTEPLSMDQAFIERLSKIVLANLSDETFGAEKLAKEAGMSRTSLYRRLQSSKHQNISQFIREMRLKRAMEMLMKNVGTASEVAFRVGFGSSTYFIKCFHEYYGFPPGEVRKRFPVVDEDVNEPVKEGPAQSRQFHAALTEAPDPGKKINRKMVILLPSVIVVVLVLILVFLYVSRHEVKEMSIIVLPFKNLSDKPENQHIADGIMEDILNNLYHISELRVISRTTSEHFRETTLTSGEIARQLNVRNVLEGSYREYDNKVRISVQLIDARRDHHLWSDNFDRELNDILGIQGEVALQIANKLNAKLADNELNKIQEVPTGNPEAYNYYLKGRFLRNKSGDESRTDVDKEGLMGSIQYFEKAINADSSFAEAYANLAGAWFSLSGWGWLQSNEGFVKAKDLSLKALKIDPDCAEAHKVKGDVHFWNERNFEEGRKEYLTCMRLNPDYPPVFQSYTQLLMVTGPIEEARTFIDQALELEPWFWVLHNLNAWIYYFEGRHKEAIETCSIARDLKSDYIFTNWLLFLNYSKLGNANKAVEELQTILKINTGDNRYTAEISDVSGRAGIEGIFKWLIDLNINKPVPGAGLSGHPYFIAWWYAIMGDKENSIYWLERNMEAKQKASWYFDQIAQNPDFDILRNDPRFLVIIEKSGLTPYHTRKAKQD